MNRGERGSVLIETMVAAAIIAIMLAAMYRGIGDSARRDHIATEKRMALLIAQSEMDTVGTTVPLASGVTAGVEGQYVWRITIFPYSIQNDSAGAGQLMQVTVSVRDGQSGASLVSLSTLAFRLV